MVTRIAKPYHYAFVHFFRDVKIQFLSKINNTNIYIAIFQKLESQWVHVSDHLPHPVILCFTNASGSSASQLEMGHELRHIDVYQMEATSRLTPI